MNELYKREAFPVTIGSMTLYCENFKVSTIAQMTEQPTVTGLTAITNRFKKCSKLVLSGRVYDEDQPLRFVTISNNMGNNDTYNINYRGINFYSCRINGVIIEDKGDGFSYVTITLSTSSFIYPTREE